MPRGWWGAVPGGGWPATAVRGVWCQALSLPRPPVHLGGQPGFRDLCVLGAVGTGVETGHRPHSVRPCGPVLRTVGVAEARPRGGLPFAVLRGVWGQALPLPRLPALRAGCRGPLPTCCGRGCAAVGGLALAPWLTCTVRGCAPRGWRAASGFRRPPFPAARPLGGLPGPAGHVLWARVWVCAVCVVPVRCVPRCVVSPFACPSGAPFSGASVRCCARRVPAVPPSLRASLARLLATPCFFRGFVALYPFLFSLLARPSPWNAPFPCLRSGVCLGLFPCRLVFLSRWAL